jgi:release factor glutamine methyltransferase
LATNVIAFEPHQALFVPDNSPLLFYEKIAAFGKNHLNPGGKIFMETHEDYAKETADLFSLFYSDVKIKKDIFGKERMVVAEISR